ncbi:PepSY domain-containing protein [Sulfobacillus thermosulfidooxidans]|uniref:PepSY domain-containing protein n=1 Tax=Sulfobacillus thermosulfidooxidans TaxID=28034 RepID=UPI00042A25E1|nr:PepSY domain-containing protein [Sulfobacillus thermosulfidooxidans]
MMKQIWVGVIAATGVLSLSLASPPKIVPSVALTSHGSSTFTATSYRMSQLQAEKAAMARVGGGKIIHISNDTYLGQSVYDIHVLFHHIVYDVKIVQMTGQVIEIKRASEQPGIVSSTPLTKSSSSGAVSAASSGISMSQAERLALKAVGGGVVVHISPDHFHNALVFDIRVKNFNQMWDVKINPFTGRVIEKRLTTENTVGDTHSGSSRSPDQTLQTSKSQDTIESESKSVPSAPSASGTISYGINLRTVPSAYQSYVTEALHQENGTLKWVKFIHKDNGDIQVNIKIRRHPGGNIKVKDLFNSSGQLIRQTVEH